MTVEFTTSAREEWTEAVDYYNDQRAGLGYEFVLEVDRAAERVAKFPEAWAKIAPRTRRILLDRFPYGLLYYVDADRIVVTAVMNLRRKPQDRQ